MTGPAAEPSFVLSGPDGTMITEGVAACYRDPAAALADLRSGAVPIIVGALPFAAGADAALHAPARVRRTAKPPVWPSAVAPAAAVTRTLPDAAEHRRRVAEAVRRLRCSGELQKVVLARALELTAQRPWDVRAVLSRLAAADPAAHIYLADLTPAGGPFTGSVLVGASPELLVERTGDVVTCHPFAGSAPRSADPSVDRANAAALADSGKNRHEHQLVVDMLRDALQPLCAELRVVDKPELHRTDALWHLGTPITGRLRQTSSTALDLALLLHPTPAVGGVPTAVAAELIAELEGDRGFYAGAVGWCDGRGDGRWVVAIRGAQLAPDRRHALAHSGGGIVAESDPDDEVDETTTKFRTILAGLGVPQ